MDAERPTSLVFIYLFIHIIVMVSAVCSLAAEKKRFKDGLDLLKGKDGRYS